MKEYFDKNFNNHPVINQSSREQELAWQDLAIDFQRLVCHHQKKCFLYSVCSFVDDFVQLGRL